MSSILSSYQALLIRAPNRLKSYLEIKTYINATQVALDNYKVAADYLNASTPLPDDIQRRVEICTNKAAGLFDRATDPSHQASTVKGQAGTHKNQRLHKNRRHNDININPLLVSLPPNQF
ncbi:hypothetical protein KIN20_001757 [Parelaphostrongylus tenuis]|uniref:Uncharacterized protein n=1 Tax=Parelaphostrongylus tenuis TaxID=148309 RepID=A0AAD5LU56_PARTN|nr:hypothetical protein KIN20_001757 [Parelaphostrongylus tenuis]